MMQQPDNYIQPGKEHLVYRLRKLLYGLKKSPRCWNKVNWVVIYISFRIESVTSLKGYLVTFRHGNLEQQHRILEVEHHISLLKVCNTYNYIAMPAYILSHSYILSQCILVC